ncbi:MAG: AAA family ATPase [Limnochordaceae bacterium]|nr:AAA family ATPase [Limnochordaceae bacterium]
MNSAPALPAPAPVRPASPLRFHRIVLRGFGPFRDGVEVELPDGLGVLVAPNEWGKSTIVAGISAVLFGLPGSSNPRAFGQARYRNRDHPSRFEGVLEFTGVDGVRYRLVRSFDNHRVRLQRLDGKGQATTELETTHNPAGRRPNARFQQRLLQLVGMASRELFLQTFCVQQPLPDPSDPKQPVLSEEVRRLLSGAGTGAYDAALQALLGQLRSLTRRKADLGVGAQNDDKDREVEILEARAAALQQALEQGRRQADELQQVQQELARAVQERGELQGEAPAGRKSPAGLAGVAPPGRRVPGPDPGPPGTAQERGAGFAACGGHRRGPTPTSGTVARAGRALRPGRPADRAPPYPGARARRARPHPGRPSARRRPGEGAGGAGHLAQAHPPGRAPGTGRKRACVTGRLRPGRPGDSGARA